MTPRPPMSDTTAAVAVVLTVCITFLLLVVLAIVADSSCT